MDGRGREPCSPGGVMPELVQSARGPSPEARESPRECSAEPTFADIATQYLERHVRRHLVPRAYALAPYAHAFLATVEVPGPTGGTVPFPEKPLVGIAAGQFLFMHRRQPI